MNVLGSSHYNSPNSGADLLAHIHETEVEEMKRITNEFKNNFKKNTQTTPTSELDSKYYDSINITGENLDTILDCPEEEEYESQKKHGKIFLNSSYSHSRRRACNRRLQKRVQLQPAPARKVLRTRRGAAALQVV